MFICLYDSWLCLAKRPGGFSSHFRTSVSILRFLHFSIFHLSSHAQFTCSYQSLGMRHYYESTGLHSKHVGVGLLQLWCQSDITVQICKLAELAKQKQNQETNKTGTLSHGVSEVTILHNSKLHSMASLDLLILQKLEIQQNWNFTTWHLCTVKRFWLL